MIIIVIADMITLPTITPMLVPAIELVLSFRTELSDKGKLNNNTYTCTIKL